MYSTVWEKGHKKPAPYLIRTTSWGKCLSAPPFFCAASLFTCNVVKSGTGVQYHSYLFWSFVFRACLLVISLLLLFILFSFLLYSFAFVYLCFSSFVLGSRWMWLDRDPHCMTSRAWQLTRPCLNMLRASLTITASGCLFWEVRDLTLDGWFMWQYELTLHLISFVVGTYSRCRYYFSNPRVLGEWQICPHYCLSPVGGRAGLPFSWSCLPLCAMAARKRDAPRPCHTRRIKGRRTNGSNSGAVEFGTHHVSVANQCFSQLHIAAVIICNLTKVRLPARAQGQCRQGKVKWAFSYIFLMACGSVVCVTAASLALLLPSLIRLCFLMISHLEQWLKTGNSCK